MSAVDALFWVVCLVLVVAGSSKLVAPEQVAATLAGLGGPRRQRSGSGEPGLLAARVVGAVEVVLGIAGLAVGGVVVTVAIAAVYAAFAVVVVLARRRGLASCGCFGSSNAPPSWVHVAVNAGSGAVALIAASASGGPVPAADGLSSASLTVASITAALVLLATVLVVALDTVVADVVEATRALQDQDRGVESA